MNAPMSDSYQEDEHNNEYDDSHNCKGDGDSGNLTTFQGCNTPNKVSNLKIEAVHVFALGYFHVLWFGSIQIDVIL